MPGDFLRRGTAESNPRRRGLEGCKSSTRHFDNKSRERTNAHRLQAKLTSYATDTRDGVNVADNKTMITHQPKEVSYDSKRPSRLASRLPRLHAIPVRPDETGTDRGLDSLAYRLGFERRTRTITDWQGLAAVMVGLVLATLALGAINALTGEATETQAGHSQAWQGRRLVARVSWGARSGGVK